MLGKMLRRLPRELFQHGLERGIRSFVCHTRLQTKVHEERPHGILRYRQRKIDVRVVPVEARRDNTYDLVTLVIELQHSSDHAGIAEKMLSPELVGENGDWLRVLSIHRVGRQNSAAQEH